MSETLSIEAVVRAAHEEFRKAAPAHLTPKHLELIQSMRGHVYTLTPRADDWETVVGFVPEPAQYQEVGFTVPDEATGGTVVLARLLLSRLAGNGFLRADWYPTNYDPKKHPY
jgi:uncharacterized protein YciU (UPF0263 family)